MVIWGLRHVSLGEPSFYPSDRGDHTTSLAATGEGLRDETMFTDVYKAQLITANNVREESHQEERIQLTT